MQLTNAIKKLEANGFDVKVDGHMLTATKGGQMVGCPVGNGAVGRFYTKDVDSHSNAALDLFVETWHGNLTQAIKFANKYSKV
jgi:hypothetical protein